MYQIKSILRIDWNWRLNFPFRSHSVVLRQLSSVMRYAMHIWNKDLRGYMRPFILDSSHLFCSIQLLAIAFMASWELFFSSFFGWNFLLYWNHSKELLANFILANRKFEFSSGARLHEEFYYWDQIWIVLP